MDAAGPGEEQFDIVEQLIDIQKRVDETTFGMLTRPSIMRRSNSGTSSAGFRSPNQQ